MFHNRGCANCCVWRSWAHCPPGNDSINGRSDIRRSTLSTPLEFADLKRLPGIDGPSTVTTEITGGPRPVSQDLILDNEGASPKARKLLGWFRRASIDEPRRRSGVDEENIGLYGTASPRKDRSMETTTTGITVSYDIRRTVEEMRRESSSAPGPSDSTTVTDNIA
jgi:hypothetical protein